MRIHAHATTMPAILLCLAFLAGSVSAQWHPAAGPGVTQVWDLDETDWGNQRVVMVTPANDGTADVYVAGLACAPTQLGPRPQDEIRPTVECGDLGNWETQMFVARLGPFGQWRWGRLPSTAGYLKITGIAADQQGRLFVTGHAASSVTFAIGVSIGPGEFLAVADADGNWLSAGDSSYSPTRYHDVGVVTLANRWGTVRAMAVTKKGDSNSISFRSFDDPDLHEAEEILGAHDNEWPTFVDLEVIQPTGDDLIWAYAVFGYTDGSGDSFNVVKVRLNENGNAGEPWGTDRPEVTGCRPQGLAVGINGTAYVAATCWPDGAGNPAQLQIWRWDSNGLDGGQPVTEPLLVAQVGDTPHDPNDPNEPNESSSASLAGIEVRRGETGGNLLFVVGTFDGELTLVDDPNDLNDPNNIFLESGSANDCWGEDVLVAHAVDAVGGASWAWGTANGNLGAHKGDDHQMAGSGLDNLWSRAVTINGYGQVTVGGHLRRSALFGDTVVTTQPQDLDNRDGFVARLDQDGNWAKEYAVGEPIDPGEVGDPDNNHWEVDFNQSEILAPAGGQVGDFFRWSPEDGALIPARPGFAQVYWSERDGQGQEVASKTETVAVGWPAVPQYHVAGAPVDLLDPSGVWMYEALTFSEDTDAAVSQERFTATQPGHAAVLFHDDGGPDTDDDRYRVTAVRTVLAEDDAVVDTAQTCVIGEALTGPDGESRGFVLATWARYDGVGPLAAHDNSGYSGPIVPVNTNGPDDDEHLDVAWYTAEADTGVLWPDRVVRYAPSWPAAALTIDVAEEVGSERPLQPALNPAVHALAHIYVQDNPDLPGYNPNDEHAFLAGANPEDVCSIPNCYKEAGQWAFRVYQVTEASTTPSYPAVAGELLDLPYPLRQVEGCPDTWFDGKALWQDYTGDLWARAATDASVKATAFAYYRLRPGFYHSTVASGGCVPWLPDTATVTFQDPLGTPTPITYDVDWPDETPVLQVGQTLFEATEDALGRDLPDIYNAPVAEVVWEEVLLSDDPNSLPLGSRPSPWTSLVRVFDPLEERRVSLTALHSDIITVTRHGRIVPVGNASGVLLPTTLRLRLWYDEPEQELVFEGYLDDNTLDKEAPKLLPNVMTTSERDYLCDWISTGWRSEVNSLFSLSRDPAEICDDPNALCLGLDDILDEDGNLTSDDDQDGLPDGDDVPEPVRALGGDAVLSTGASPACGWVTVALNNDANAQPLQPKLDVLRVSCEGGPFTGVVYAYPPDNYFERQLTLRHSGLFGGDPEGVIFAWALHADEPGHDADENGRPDLPPDGWPVTSGTPNAIELTIRTPEFTPAEVLQDNWVAAAYSYAPAGDCTEASGWAGDPSLAPGEGPEPQLAEGWIKRALKGFNLFDARRSDFHADQAAPATYASMIQEAGPRFEGARYLDAASESIDQLGLIEGYETILREGMELVFPDPAHPQPESPAANNALLLVSSRIAQLYALLGNEAYADALDPMIGYDTFSGEYGYAAPSIFAFQDQAPSLLAEELALLRGVSDPRGASTYNRLVWNFTTGMGEVAYSQVYNMGDVNRDGFVTEADAKIMYPQGHGDAWGHYLTGLMTYYRLLRHPKYEWRPRAESIGVDYSALAVDFRDERELAGLAAARARAGAEIVDLVYRQSYTEDPEGQWQGYVDGDTERAWGLSEWGRRAGQGAYFDWAVANAILPARDPNDPPDPEDLQVIDRATTPELQEIASHAANVQAQVDEADRGLNPLGLAKGVVPFDIDPSQVDSGQTHFEQIYSRAASALDNAVTVFDHANQFNQMLRRNQDTLADFQYNVQDGERDLVNRLIEIFGYPYSDDMGFGKTYPEDFDGPDIYHYWYVDSSALTGDEAPTQVPNTRSLKGVFGKLKGLNSFCIHHDPLKQDECAEYADPDQDGVAEIKYTQSLSDMGLVKPDSWTGRRRAQGELQVILSDWYRARASHEQAVKEYEALLGGIDGQYGLLKLSHDIDEHEILVLEDQRDQVKKFNRWIRTANHTALALRQAGQVARDVAQASAESIASSWKDFASTIRGLIYYVGFAVANGLESGAVGAEDVMTYWQNCKENLQQQSAVHLQYLGNDEQIASKIAEIEQLVRQEPALRLECFNRKEAVKQVMQEFLTKLAEGERLIQELVQFRTRTAGSVQEYRYQDMAFRVMRNDALQKYRAQFDLASRYAFLAAAAYDYETNLLGGDTGAGQQFLTEIVRHRSIGQVLDGEPLAGAKGLSDPLARMKLNFEVLKGQMGFNNPQIETNRFSMRHGHFRLAEESDERWRTGLKQHMVRDLWQLPEFRRFCRPFAPEDDGPQPGLVIPFDTTVTYNLNYFGEQLGGGDSAYDPSHFGPASTSCARPRETPWQPASSRWWTRSCRCPSPSARSSSRTRPGSR